MRSLKLLSLNSVKKRLIILVFIGLSAFLAQENTTQAASLSVAKSIFSKIGQWGTGTLTAIFGAKSVVDLKKESHEANCIDVDLQIAALLESCMEVKSQFEQNTECLLLSANSEPATKAETDFEDLFSQIELLKSKPANAKCVNEPTPGAKGSWASLNICLNKIYRKIESVANVEIDNTRKALIAKTCSNEGQGESRPPGRNHSSPKPRKN